MPDLFGKDDRTKFSELPAHMVLQKMDHIREERKRQKQIENQFKGSNSIMRLENKLKQLDEGRLRPSSAQLKSEEEKLLLEITQHSKDFSDSGNSPLKKSASQDHFSEHY